MSLYNYIKQKIMGLTAVLLLLLKKKYKLEKIVFN